MSDPVTNVDVEDVLSSIRRLVSDTNSEDRQEIKAPEPDQPEVEEVAAEAAKPADALILTSALRVNSEETDSVPEFRHTEMSNLRHTLGGDVPEEDDAETAEADNTDWAALADEEYYEDDEPLESAPVIDFIRHGNTPMREVEVVLEQGAEALSESHSDEVGSDHDEAGDVEASADVQDWGNEDSSSSDEPEHVVEDVDAVELAEEIMPEDDAAPAEPMVEEVVFASAAAASVMDKTPEPKPDNVDLADFDESVLDEDALRDLVAEIVREELTGELGERITRNVRKLVRREIHRAMLTREFE